MAAKASALLCSFLLAILLIPSITSARELLQSPQVHTAGGEGIANEAGIPYRATRPDKPAGGGRRGQPYTPNNPTPYVTPKPLRPDKPVIGGRPGQPYTRGKPYHGPSPPNIPTP